MQKLKFEIETDYFHLVPTQKFLKKLIEASTETQSIIGLEIVYERTSKSYDNVQPYTITGKRTERLVDMTRTLINAKTGESIILTFDDSVTQDYINDFKNKV